jgi:hypothetical protein
MFLAGNGLCQSERITPSGKREITQDEARDLLKAFLKLPDEDMQKSGDLGYKQFYFFMAILGTSGGEVGVLQVRYYAVDRQTADVWNSVICERMTTPLLRKLQAALRKSIGLTDAEYRKIRTQGPLCEAGMPRVPDGN